MERILKNYQKNWEYRYDQSIEKLKMQERWWLEVETWKLTEVYSAKFLDQEKNRLPRLLSKTRFFLTSASKNDLKRNTPQIDSTRRFYWQLNMSGTQKLLPQMCPSFQKVMAWGALSMKRFYIHIYENNVTVIAKKTKKLKQTSFPMWRDSIRNLGFWTKMRQPYGSFDKTVFESLWSTVSAVPTKFHLRTI